MATSAFKSTTRRAPIGSSPNSTTDESSSSANRSASAHRRSRSLSRFSWQLPVEDKFVEETPRGRFVNKVRGTGFPEISLDDLAIELFDSSVDRGRSASRNGDVSGNKVSGGGGGGGGGGGSVRRGRSVSRQGAKVSGGETARGGRVAPGTNSNSRRRRSMSVVRYQISDSESDIDHSQKSGSRPSLKSSINPGGQMSSSHRVAASSNRPALRRSISQKDLRHNDGYSSHSSAITDDEGLDGQLCTNGIEKIVKAVYAQKRAENPNADDSNGGLYDAMRRELRHAVEEIKMELEQTMSKSKRSSIPGGNSVKSKNSEPLQAVSAIRRSYATKIEQSEKRKQDLLAEMVLEEQRSKELSKIVKELLPDPKDSIVEKPSRTRKRSSDKHRMSTRLTEEAEKYIEDFISNVEDTDISSIDGERSDTSSTLGGIMKTETFQTPPISKPFPLETDGVVLPWLQWETTNDASPQSRKNNTTHPRATPNRDVSKESITGQDSSYRSASSRGSCSPSSTNCTEDKGNKYEKLASYQNRFSPSQTTRPTVDVDEYLKRPSDEELLLERWTQRHRIDSGSLLLCNNMFF